MAIAAFSSTAGRRTRPPGMTEAHKDRRQPSPCDGAAFCLLVRKEGLEPPRVTPPEPKSGASANSATCAWSLLSLMMSKNISALDFGEGTSPGAQISRAAPLPIVATSRVVFTQFDDV